MKGGNGRERMFYSILLCYAFVRNHCNVFVCNHIAM